MKGKRCEERGFVVGCREFGVEVNHKLQNHNYKLDLLPAQALP